MILIVDDCAEIRSALCAILKGDGYACMSLSSGNHCLKVLSAHASNHQLLVVLDQMMPEMSGIDVLRKIRADRKLASTPVVMFAAGCDDDLSSQALSLGALDCILKTDIDAVERICQWYTGTVAAGSPEAQ